MCFGLRTCSFNSLEHVLSFFLMYNFFGELEAYKQGERLRRRCIGKYDLEKKDLVDLKNSLEDLCEFEELIFHLDSQEKFEKLKSLLPRYNNYFIQKILVFAAGGNPMYFKLYGDIFKLTGEVEWDMEPEHDFIGYIFARGLVNDDAFYKYGEPNSEEYSLRKVSDYENPVPFDTAKYYIWRDDPPGYIDFLKRKKIPLDKGVVAHCKFMDRRITHMSMACYFNAIEMVKFFVMNDVIIEYEEKEEAIAGNSREVIDLFVQMNINLDGFIHSAICYHHNDLATWLFDNYRDNQLTLDECTFGFNTTMLLFFLNNTKANVNYPNPQTQRTPIFYSIQHNDLIITEYLLMQKDSGWRQYDFQGRQAFTYSDSAEMQVILEQKLDKGLVDPGEEFMRHLEEEEEKERERREKEKKEQKDD